MVLEYYRTSVRTRVRTRVLEYHAIAWYCHIVDIDHIAILNTGIDISILAYCNIAHIAIPGWP